MAGARMASGIFVAVSRMMWQRMPRSFFAPAPSIHRRFFSARGLARAGFCRRQASRFWLTVPGLAPTFRTISKSISRSPACSRSRCTGILACWRRRGSARNGCSSSAALAPPTSLKRLGSFARRPVSYPDIQYHFLPVAISYDGTAPAEGHGFQLHVGPMRSNPGMRISVMRMPEARLKSGSTI